MCFETLRSNGMSLDLITLPEVAECVRRTPCGLRYSLQRGDSEFARALRANQIRIGRRLYWHRSWLETYISNLGGRHSA